MFECIEVDANGWFGEELQSMGRAISRGTRIVSPRERLRSWRRIES